ncbi:MAG TPA: Gfo/Idh/MocA family oxidoreductase [Bryobacteraceae bacterium]|nr:Gfo/Idh/MocA family oxidoreductase [Bryobacteraceae bacterium]
MQNDRVQFALIGAGGMGMGDARYQTALGSAIVAVSDLYDGRLQRAKEIWGSQILTTRDYREVLARKDIDAVIVATPDHWHSRITIDALEAGKDVYCEKPMVQKIEQGHQVIAAHKKTDRILQIGSQYASSLVYQKARELLQAGSIGKLNMVEAWLDRNTAIGAWQYSIAPDASEQTIDWDRFLGSAPKRPFDAVRFFRWRNYRDYGTGVAGDLFVHLLTGLHFSTGVQGPARVYATGGLRYWKDGRDVPDVMLATMDYPDFTLRLRVNFKSSEPKERFGFQFIGSEGTLTTSYNDVLLARHPRETEPGYTIETFPEAVQKRFLAEYRREYPPARPTADGMRPDKDEHYIAPAGHDAHLEHHRNFLTAVRTRKPFLEDGVFGLRAAGPALLTNTSYYEQRICHWDSHAMTAS